MCCKEKLLCSPTLKQLCNCKMTKTLLESSFFQCTCFPNKTYKFPFVCCPFSPHNLSSISPPLLTSAPPPLSSLLSRNTFPLAPQNGGEERGVGSLFRQGLLSTGGGGEGWGGVRGEATGSKSQGLQRAHFPTLVWVASLWDYINEPGLKGF